MAAIQRPSGDHAGWLAQPAGGEDLARLGGRGRAAGPAPRFASVDVDGPDRGPRMEVGVGAAVGGEGDRSGRPDARRCPTTPQSPLVTWRGRAARARSTTNRCDQRSRWPSLVPAPVGAGDVAGSRRGRLGGGLRIRSASATDGRRRPDDEPRRIDLGGEGEAPAVRRPGDLADGAVIAASGRTRRACRACEVEQADRRRRVVVGRVRPDERERPPIRARAAARCRGRRPGVSWRGRGDRASIERRSRTGGRDSGRP